MQKHPLFHRKISRKQEKKENSQPLRFFYEIKNKGETYLICLLWEIIRYWFQQKISWIQRKRRIHNLWDLSGNKQQRRNRFKLSFVRKHPLLHGKDSYKGEKRRIPLKNFMCCNPPPTNGIRLRRDLNPPCYCKNWRHPTWKFGSAFRTYQLTFHFLYRF